MLRSFSNKTNKNLIMSLRGPQSRSISTGGFYRSSEELNKLKREELPDDKVNELIRKGEEQKKHEMNPAIETEGFANIHKAQKKIKKMVPKDVEKFD